MARMIKYYDDVTDDFVTSAHQDIRIPDDYQWEHSGWWWQARRVVVTALARVAGWFILHVGWHVRWVNRAALRNAGKGGYFLYANHTQPVGDPFLVLAAGQSRGFAAVVSGANLGIPFLGRILPWVGALPIPEGMHGLARFNHAVRTQIDAGRYVAIFPEAHVWPYYTGIRPFSTAAFHYPVATQAPVYTMTVTYQHRRWGRHPRMTVFIDGPLRPNATLSRKQQQVQLADMVARQMRQRSAESTYTYITYQRRD